MHQSFLCVTLLGLVVGVASLSDVSDGPGVANESSITKQFGSPYAIQRRPPVRFVRGYRPPRIIQQQQPVRFVRVQPNFPYRSVSIRQRQRVVQESTSRSSNGLSTFLFYFVFSQLFTMTTATPACTVGWGSWTECNVAGGRHRTRTCPSGLETELGSCYVAPACTVSWGSWTNCDLAGARHRTRTCPTGLETEQGICFVDCLQWTQWTTCPSPMTFVDVKRTRTRDCSNGHEIAEEGCQSCTTPGLTSDGWYRASNGYEYKYFKTPTTWGQAAAGCKFADPTAALAAVGARSGILDTGLDFALMGVDARLYYVGGTDGGSEGQWVFSDNVVLPSSSITWGRLSATEPTGNTNENCLIWIHGIVPPPIQVGLGDLDCDRDEPYMCERLAKC